MDLSSPTIHKSGNTLSVTYGDDNSNYVEFEMVAVPNASKSAEAGCPQFDDKPFIRIMFPGDKTKVVHRPVKAEDKMKYPRQYAAFVAQETQVSSGFHIDKWPPITKAEAQGMKAMGIHTVEALANLPDTALSWFGARKYRDMATAYLAQAKDGGAVLELQAKNEALAADLQAMKQQLQDLSAKTEKTTLNLNKKES